MTLDPNKDKAIAALRDDILRYMISDESHLSAVAKRELKQLLGRQKVAELEAQRFALRFAESE